MPVSTSARIAAPSCASRKSPLGPDELERVPLDRVVAGRDHQAARGVMVLDGQLAGRRRGQPDVDHVAPDRSAAPQRRRDGTSGPRPGCRGRRRSARPLPRGPSAHAPNAAANRATISGVSASPTRPRTPETLTINPSYTRALPLWSARKLPRAMSRTKRALRMGLAARSMSADSMSISLVRHSMATVPEASPCPGRSARGHRGSHFAAKWSR